MEQAECVHKGTYTNSVDPKRGISSGSTLFANIHILKIDKTKVLKTGGSLVQNAILSSFCNTFDLH